MQAYRHTPTVIRQTSYASYAASIVGLQASSTNVSAEWFPGELLSKIFEIAYASIQSRIKTTPRSGSSLTLELSVSQVNRHWREVAINTPPIWCHIEINGSPKSIPVSDTYIKRSADRLLDIYFYDRSYIQEFSSYVIPHLRRCKSLYVGCGDHNFRSAFVNLVRPKLAPELQQLVLDSVEDPENQSHGQLHAPLTVFMPGGTPKLQSFAIRGAAFTCTAETSRSLVSIHIHFAGDQSLIRSYEDLYTMLSGARALENLVIHEMYLADYVEGLPLELPSLKFFEYRNTESLVDLVDIVKHLDAPRLERVSIRTRDTDNLLGGIEQVAIERPFLSVRSLTFEAGDRPDDNSNEHWQILGVLFPNITHLTVAYQEITNSERLTEWLGRLEADDGLPWSSLKTLSVMGSGDANRTDINGNLDGLANALLVRQKNYSAITTLRWPRSLLHAARYLDNMEAFTSVVEWDGEDDVVVCFWMDQ